MSDKQYIGLDLTGFENKGRARPVSRVTLLVDDNNALTAGDDTGLELTAECPHATQAMADAILARLKGYTYQMYSATAADLDPAAELGDGVTAGGIYSVISRIHDGGSGYPDLEAAGQAEPEDEFPTEGPMTRAFNRKIADTRASITKTAESIKLEVSKTYATKDALGDTETRLSSSITQTAEGITSAVSKTYATKDALSSAQQTLQSSITQNAESIALRVEKSGVISAINQSAEKIAIQAGKISLEGLVTVNKTFQIDAQGYLTCTGGKIGGWTIGTNSIYNGIQYTFGKKTNSTGMGPVTANQEAFWAGDGRFFVLQNGALHAENADISGTVNATSGTFQSVTITGSSFGGTLNGATGSLSGVTGSYSGSINSGGTFRGTATGTLTGTASSATLSSCNLGGTSLLVSAGSAAGIKSYSSGCEISGQVVFIRTNNTNFTSSGTAFNKPLNVYSSLSVSGDKDRMIKTPHYGTRCLAAFETPLPTFSDYGTGRLDETGVCCITIDPVFAETVNRDYRPTVFLTPWGEGALWVERAEHDVITVKGAPGLRFSWEARYAQTNAYVQRLKVLDFDAPETSGEYDFDSEAAVRLEHTAPNLEISAWDELTRYASAAVDYGQAGYKYYTEFERRLTA